MRSREWRTAVPSASSRAATARRARSRRRSTSSLRSPKLAVGSASTGRDRSAARASCWRATRVATQCRIRCRTCRIRASSSAASGTTRLAASVGRGGAVVGHQVEDRVVRLVPDRADHRGPAGGDGPDQALVGERQQVLQRAATPGDDDHVDLGLAVQPAQRRDHLLGRLRALDQRVPDQQPDPGPAAAGVLDHVAFGGAVRAGDQPDRRGAGTAAAASGPGRTAPRPAAAAWSARAGPAAGPRRPG